jgi:hypothetical protein
LSDDVRTPDEQLEKEAFFKCLPEILAVPSGNAKVIQNDLRPVSLAR